jgi:hypothetical protein
MSTFSKSILYALFAVIVAIFALNERIQQGRFLSALAPFLQFCMPAKDLHTPLVSDPIDVSNDVKLFEYTFTNRYVGSHAFGVMAKGLSPSIADATIPAFSMAVEFIVDGSQVLMAQAEDPAYCFWSDHGDGYAFLRYKVPGDVPIGKAVHCRVKITRADAAFQSNHSPVTVYAARE